MLKHILIFTITLSIFQCSKTKRDDTDLFQSDEFCGRYLVQKLGGNWPYLYHSPDTTIQLNHPKEGVDYCDFCLMNTKESIIGICSCDNLDSCKRTIFIEDVFGNNFKELLSIDNASNIGALSLSNDDSRLLFVTETKWKSGSTYRESLYYNTIHVIELSSKEIIYRTKPVLSSAGLFTHENSWNTEKNQFVFVAPRYQDYEKPDANFYLKQGVYICDINKDELLFIDDGGADATWSASGKYIAYTYNNDIKKYDVLNKKSTIIYSEAENENINSIHWNPCNADELFIVSWITKNKVFNTGHTLEQILNVEHNKIIQRKSVAIGESLYSWVK